MNGYTINGVGVSLDVGGDYVGFIKPVGRILIMTGFLITVLILGIGCLIPLVIARKNILIFTTNHNRKGVGLWAYLTLGR